MSEINMNYNKTRKQSKKKFNSKVVYQELPRVRYFTKENAYLSSKIVLKTKKSDPFNHHQFNTIDFGNVNYFETSQTKEEASDIKRLQAHVNSGKNQIQELKTKLEGLEVQIMEIAEKTDKYKLKTDEIIQGITNRIVESEREYRMNSPMQKEHWDITMSKVKASAKHTFKHFTLSWQEDVKDFQKAVSAELINFRKILDMKKCKLESELDNEIGHLSPCMYKH